MASIIDPVEYKKILEEHVKVNKWRLLKGTCNFLPDKIIVEREHSRLGPLVFFDDPGNPGTMYKHACDWLKLIPLAEKIDDSNV